MQISKPRLRLFLFSFGLALYACEQRLPPWNSGRLVIAIPESTQGAEAEFERELIQLFADQLHTSVDTVTASPENLRAALLQHKTHLAVASVHTDNPSSELKFGPDYRIVKQLVICNRDHSAPKKLADLEEKHLAVASNSPQEAALMEGWKRPPGLNWKTFRRIPASELLEKVAEGSLDCAVANELQFVDALSYHPNLVAAFDVGSPFKLAWQFPVDTDPELINQTNAFFAKIEKDRTLQQLLERYFGHINWLATTDGTAFISGINTVLPRYRRLFEEAATITGEDWRLLAALAYQESQWDPLATSYTNVRGMMMLTEDTADRMKVENRLDARESIIAGARYLALLKEQMPGRIPEPDRTWLALAAYNQGYSHLEDARILTQRAKMNPDSWLDVKKCMPLLNRPNYYQTLKHGYARGGEAVALVENIRNYYDMLKRLSPEQDHTAAGEITYRLIEPLQRLLHYSR